jgi:hypothetical protein
MVTVGAAVVVVVVAMPSRTTRANVTVLARLIFQDRGDDVDLEEMMVAVEDGPVLGHCVPGIVKKLLLVSWRGWSWFPGCFEIEERDKKRKESR